MKTKAKPELVFHSGFEQMGEIEKRRHSVDGKRDFYGKIDQMPEIVSGIKGNAFKFSKDHDQLYITNKLIHNLYCLKDQDLDQGNEIMNICLQKKNNVENVPLILQL